MTGQATMLHTSSDIAALYVYDGGTGSPVALLTDFSSTSFQYKYDPYGLPTLQYNSGGNGVGQNPFAFKSGIQDRATGFVKFGQRWYNPVSGTWTQEDTLDSPLRTDIADRYAYAGGDPINNIDPTGACTETDYGCVSDDGYCSASVGCISTALTYDPSDLQEVICEGSIALFIFSLPDGNDDPGIDYATFKSLVGQITSVVGVADSC